MFCPDSDTEQAQSCVRREGEMNKPKLRSFALCALLLALCASAEAQQPKGVPRIGVLSRGLHPSDSRAPSPHNFEAFRQGLRELGYIEGKNIIIESRYAEGRFERFPALAEEVVRLKVEIIVVDSFTTASAVKKATTIPIVVAGGATQVGSGLVASLARPGGNVTGLTNISTELLGKRLELLKEVVPKVTRFAFLSDSDSESSKAMFKETQVATQTLGVKFQLVEVKAQDPDFDGAFRLMAKERIGAIVVSPSPRLNVSLHQKRILELLEQARMPAMHPNVSWMDDGGLMYYGANSRDLYRRAATYVDKILKGTKPADLPVQQPKKFEFIVNLKAAKQIGLTIPPNVLVRADKVFKEAPG
jgi:putative tryptophan/tyrosine transport system substrate-binding protein